MTPAVIILAHATDHGAGLVAGWLVRELGVTAVRIVRPETLSLAQWSLRIDVRGRAVVRAAWEGTATIEDCRVGAVLNRIHYLPSPRFHRSCAKDRDYAGAEIQAVVSSWLGRYGDRVVPDMRRDGRLTPVLPLQHWAAAAAANGLPVAVRTVTNSTRALRWRTPTASGGRGASAPEEVAAGSVLVAGDQAGGLLAGQFGAGCITTARALGFPLLEFRFASSESETVLSDVNPLPPLGEAWEAALTGQLLASLATEGPS
jgi:hypothetical protein